MIMGEVDVRSQNSFSVFLLKLISWVGFIGFTLIICTVKISGNIVREQSKGAICKPAALWTDCVYQKLWRSCKFFFKLFYYRAAELDFSILFCQENVRLVLLSPGHCASQSLVE